MTTKDARELADYLTSTLPSKNQSFDDYMSDALARWPALSEADVAGAVERAADMSRTGAARSFNSLERQHKSRP